MASASEILASPARMWLLLLMSNNQAIRGPSSLELTQDLTPATALWEAVALTATPQPVNVALTPATGTWSAVQATGTPGQVTQALTPATGTWSAVVLAVTPQPVNVALTPATGTWSAVAVAATPGQVTRALTPATGTWSAVTLTATPGQVTQALTPATGTWSAVPLTATPGSAVTLTPATGTWSAVTLTATPGQVTQALTPATATWSAVAVNPGSQGTVDLTPATATWSAVTLGPQPQPVQVPLVSSQATFTAPSLDPAPQTVTVDLLPAAAVWSAVPLALPATHSEEVVLVADIQVNAILDMALLCLNTAATSNPNPPETFCRRLDLQVAHDMDLYDDLCCRGLGYVSFGDIFPSWESFPEPAVVNQANRGSCGIPSWGVNIRLGMIRCLPVGTETEMPTCEEWTAASIQQTHDAQALRAATCCLREWVTGNSETPGMFWGMSVVIGNQSQIQLQGGCVERNVEMTFQIPNCDCFSLE